jgi:hypothetical protein
VLRRLHVPDRLGHVAQALVRQGVSGARMDAAAVGARSEP